MGKDSDNVENNRSPKWLEESTQAYQAFISQNELHYQLLLAAKDKHESGFYSNANLHSEVKKEQQCKDILLKLQAEKETLNKELRENQELWEKKQVEVMEMDAKLKQSRSKLILDLIEWQYKSRKARAPYDRATTEFNVIKARIEKNKSQNDLVVLTKEYSEFLKNYGEFVKLANSNADKQPGSPYLDECQSRIKLTAIDVIEKIPSHSELSKKSITELKALAALTEQQQLIQAASNCESELLEYEKAQRLIQEGAPAGLKKLNDQEHAQLILEAGHLANEYQLAANKKLSESKAALDAIDKEAEQLLDQIKMVTDSESPLNIARREYFSAKRKMPKDVTKRVDPVILDEVIRKYDTLKDIFTATLQFNAYNKKTELTRKYKETGEKFGVSQIDKITEFSKASKEAFAVFEEVTDLASGMVRDNQKTITDKKADLVLEKMLLLFKSAIENNVAFWNRQISWLGSGYEINKVKVPHGIAKLHPRVKFMAMCPGPQEALKLLQDIVKKRIAAGHGFFARRTISTTDKFYNILNDINVGTIAEKINAGKTPDEVVKEVETKLKDIKDDKGGLGLVNVFGNSAPSIFDKVAQKSRAALPPVKVLPEIEGMPALEVSTAKPTALKA